ncbi:MAG: tetratricopeptide (TPR) repeat protein [Verrucomicrobiales bacterium]|jgi:tetratricopeptide (TPR) repeat protein
MESIGSRISRSTTGEKEGVAKNPWRLQDGAMNRVALLLFSLLLVQLASAESFLVEDGESRAEIIIAKDPPRTVHLAARDLQVHVEKITGAKLEIVTEPADRPVKIYVGESPHTRKLGVTAEGLDHGAYRMVSGEDWLVLLGQDRNFTPIEPWPRNNNDIASGKMQAEWDKITGAQWGYMHSQLHKHYSGRNSLFGTPEEQKTDDEGNVNTWTYDERGSFNAVCGFLRDLGVRWYMPGEIGEVLPETKSIALPKVDKTVHPDFPMRILNFRTSVYGHDAMMWGFRLGTRQPYGRQAAHGLHGMTDNERTLTNHPDWFALYGGKRHNHPNIKNNQLCYSNQELFEEAVRFARTQLDHFKMDAVSIMPPDGYTAICQCELCEGKESPELGARGQLSNYVWDFVNRVAKEVGKTHPDKRISNCAYGIYTEPPNNIEKLEPNVQVIIVGGRRPRQEDHEDLRRLRAEWAEKTDRPLEIFENYPFTGRGWYLPAYMPGVLGEGINRTKSQSRGEDIWITMDFSEKAIGYNHFQLYFTGRMYWGGEDQDPVAMFDEYVEKFYGPAAAGMKPFFSYCETNWRAMEKDSELASRALELFEVAKTQAPADSVFAQRMGLIDNFLNGLRSKATQLAQKRGPVPTLRLVSGADQRGKIVVDGKLDDGPWIDIPNASIGQLRELQTGRLPTFATSFKAERIGQNIYFAIRCEDEPGKELNVATEKDGDQAIWYGDCIEIQLATDAHSYYQIVVNPAGAIVDLDRGAPRSQWFGWSSKAEVATHVADDHWTVEIRLPITQDENDPLHQIVGRNPTKSLPWFVNVCRQRVRNEASEFSAFSPTGTSGFHEPMKFAHFFGGQSHQFEVDPTVTDYLLGRRAADALARARKWDEALAAFLALTEIEKVTEFQKSDALQQAARCAITLKDEAQAAELAAQIPIESVAKTARMQNLLARREWQAVVDELGGEELSQWPFWQIAEAAFARARAYYIVKDGEAAAADLELALRYERDSRIVVSIRMLLAQTQETLLGDPAAALSFYVENFEGKANIGGADEFRSVDRAAGILAAQRKFDEALAAFDVVNFEKTTGYWLNEMLNSKGRVLDAAGRKDEARAAFQRVFSDSAASAAQRTAAEKALNP